MIQFLVFGLLGTFLTVVGGLAYWWDASMMPTQKTSLPIVCGIITLLSQAGATARAIFDEK